MSDTYVSMFNDYPVTITAEELQNERDLDIVKEYPSAFSQRAFMNEVHASVYEGAIYATGDRDIKKRIIIAHETKIFNAIKRALILQAAYMHDEGSAGTSNGVTITADGQRAVIGRSELRSKVVCLAAFDALKACAVPILYCGE